MDQDKPIENTTFADLYELFGPRLVVVDEKYHPGPWDMWDPRSWLQELYVGRINGSDLFLKILGTERDHFRAIVPECVMDTLCDQTFGELGKITRAVAEGDCTFQGRERAFLRLTLGNGTPTGLLWYVYPNETRPGEMHVCGTAPTVKQVKDMLAGVGSMYEVEE